ncbi:MAG: family 16 glycoside hydrolase [Fimbriimonadaceae bacterium]
MSVSLFVVAALCAFQPTVPGVTVQVWEVGKNYSLRPKVIVGQTPNAYFVTQKLDLSGPIASEYGELKTKFAGTATGWFMAPESGLYEFELYVDDGGSLEIGGKPVCWVDDASRALRGFVSRAEVGIEKGLKPFRVEFFQREGNFVARVRWRQVGTSDWQVLAAPTARTEPGQTFVTSPGIKKADEGKPDSPPGEGRPLEAVHPTMTLENIRGPDYRPSVGGLAFLPDGRLAVANWNPRGTVELLSNLSGPGPAVVKEVASGLGEPLGIAWYDGHILVTQKGEVTRLADLDGDEVADRYETVSTGWPMSQNYHEFTFNLLAFQGKLNVTTSVPLRGGHTNYTPGNLSAFANGNGPGSWFSIDPNSGTWERAARGHRTPNGMGIGVDGHIYVCDNQGSWLPASTMSILKRGAFYGHQEIPDGKEPAEPPVVWFPHGEIGNSPSQPVLIPDGPFRGQMLVGDVTYGGLQRIFVEKVNGVYQGTVFRHSQGLEAGVNRLEWGPDGCLYVGGVGSNGNWNHMGHLFGLQRLRPNHKEPPFELVEVRTQKDGFELHFSHSLETSVGQRERSKSALLKTVVRQWRYERTIGYGGPKVDEQALKVTEVSVEGSMAKVKIPGLKRGGVVYLNLEGFREMRMPLYSPESWTTLNEIPDRDDEAYSFRRTTGFEPSNRTYDFLDDRVRHLWRRIVDGEPMDWPFVDGELQVKRGQGAIGANDVGFPFHGEYLGQFVHIEWLSPPGGNLADQTNGNSGVKIESRYEVQIMNAPGIVDYPPDPPKFNEAGSIYRQVAPRVNASYGPGVWQSFDIFFWPAKFLDGAKVADAVMTVYWNGVLVHDRVRLKSKTGASVEEGPDPRPFLLQDHPSGAEGPVRFRNIFGGGILEPPDPR